MHGSIAGFVQHDIASADGTVFAHIGGVGPPVLLLHGFPETALMWHAVAPLLAARYTVVAADLPGYGRSGVPADGSKRTMAAMLVAAMRALGHARFAVVGHDRGGRVAYRLALDHPATVSAAAVLDVVPTSEVWDRADHRLALTFWPFALLAQPAPLPERLILGDPAAVVDNALSTWGTPREAFPDWLRDAYVAALGDPARVAAICDEYRAAATVDREVDAADRAAGRRIACPLLLLWSGQGALADWYRDSGGPLGSWRDWAEQVEGESVPGGHFFPEEHPQATADRVMRFLAGRR